jgi:hypothetical protein
MKARKLPELGEELFLFLDALKQARPGDDWARVFAKTLSGATPDSFAEALQRILGWIYPFYQDVMGLSADDARRKCDRFEATAISEYARLLTAAGAVKAGRG